MEALTSTFDLVVAMVGLLLIAAVVLALCKRIKLPFTVVLVIVGLILAQLAQFLPTPLKGYFQHRISPDLIFYVCLPTLIFEAAYHLDYRALKHNLAPILILAIPGLLISTLLIGLIVSGFTPIGLLPALLLGAILSATDPIAVTSLFKRLGAPKRLNVLVEGESLFNDATAIVIAKILFAIVLTGVFTGTHAWHGVIDFLYEFIGGYVVGWAFAFIIGFFLGKVESDAFIEISLTVILAYGSFLIANNLFHVSGVMATVAAGLTLNKWGRTKISPSVTRYLVQFWGFLAYVANALIFLLVGFSVQINTLFAAIGMLSVVILAMLASRLVVIFGLMPFVGYLPKSEPIDKRYQTIIYWGGLRGAIALAVVLGLSNFNQYELFVALVTGAVLFTLLVPGLTIETLMRWLKLDRPPLSNRLAKIEGELSAKQQALSQIPQLQQEGLYSASISEKLTSLCREGIADSNLALNNLRKQELTEQQEQNLIYMQALATEKNLYYKLFSQGHITSQNYYTLVDLVDMQLDVLRYGGSISELRKLTLTEKTFTKLFIRFLERFPGLSRLGELLRARQVARYYEEIWALHQGSFEALKFFDDLAISESHTSKIIECIKEDFQNWHATSRKHLDNITEQFPEFVRQMQTQLAKRLLLHAEHNAIEQQVKAGTLATDVADSMKAELEQQMFKLKETPSRKIQLDKAMLLRKISLFQTLPESEFKEILKLLRSRIVPPNEIIIKQGSAGESLFLITRGVVRVLRKENGEEKELATLMAGDIIGEMALIHHEPRSATCLAVTPCALYELRRHEFNELKIKFPTIEKAIEKADRERQLKSAF